MKCLRKILFILLIFCLALATNVFATSSRDSGDNDETEQQVQEADNNALSIPVYRIYNPNNSEHLFTSDKGEVDNLVRAGWSDEGIAWKAPAAGDPVYRLYNASQQNHLYTTDRNEIQILTTQSGWTIDNDSKALFFSGGDVPVFRIYNKNLRGLHHLTTDVNEYSNLPEQGWTQEGAALYCEVGTGFFISPQEVYNRLTALEAIYPEDYPWSNANKYESKALGLIGSGCHGFALLCSDHAFGNLPGRKHNNIYDIRVGDLVRINNDNHTVIILEVNGDELTLLEGNWQHDIHWRRKISRTETPIDYIITRYPE